MKIDTLKDLEAMLKVCRKHGVTSIEVDGIKLQVLEHQEQLKTEQTTATSPPQELNDEDLLFWSSAER